MFLLAIVESAENDLLSMANIWSNEELQIERLEHFIPEKLEYICLRAMKALNYLHSINIYYGDLKPQNLLIFKDYSVKFGDFGCCIKFSDDSTEDTLAYVRGVTKEYSCKEVCKACD